MILIPFGLLFGSEYIFNKMWIDPLEEKLKSLN
jgi:hypothetical protein